MWDTSPTQDILIGLFVLSFMFAIVFFLFALMYTVSAITGRYSKASIGIYWSYLMCTIVLGIIDHTFEAFMVFGYGAPVVALVMYRIQRLHKRILTKEENDHANNQ